MEYGGENSTSLVGRRCIGFPEVSYFSASMSNVREVLASFRELLACSDRYRFIYVTDGVD